MSDDNNEKPVSGEEDTGLDNDAVQKISPETTKEEIENFSKLSTFFLSRIKYGTYDAAWLVKQIGYMFSQSGWRRMSVVGDDLKTVDMEIVLPTTGERAMIQVKSHTTQTQFEDYIQHFLQWSIDRLFYVYHSAATDLKNNEPRVILIGPEKLAEMLLNAGLLDWLLRKVG